MLAHARTTTAPAVDRTLPVTAPAPGASNQERLESLGMARTPASLSEAANPDGAGALDRLGDLATVVLDALPLPIALRMVSESPAAPWAMAWWRACDPTELIACGDAAVRMLLDRVWPVGIAVSAGVEGATSFEHVELAPGATWTLARVADGWDVQVDGRARTGASIEVGGRVTGARGETLIGAIAGAGGGLSLQVMQGWRFPSGALLAALDLAMPLLRATTGTGAPHAVAPILSARLLPLLRLTQPSRVETRLASGVSAEAGGGAGIAGDGEVGLHGACALGMDEGSPWFEVAFGGALGGRALAALAPELGEAGLSGLPRVAAGVEAELRLRVSRAPDAPVWTYALTREGASGEETAEVCTPAALLALVAPCVGLRASAAPRGALPEVALVRDVQAKVPVGDVRGWLGGAAALAAAVLPERGVVAGVREAHAEAHVRVDGLAAVAALDGAGFRGAPTEAELLDAARAVVAHVLGRTMRPALPVDPEAGAAWAEVEGEVVTRTVLAAGVGVSGSVPGVEAGGRLGGECAVVERHPIGSREAIAQVFAA